MAEAVVDRLEVVDVDQDAAEFATEAPDPHDRFIQVTVELPPIQYAGQVVDRRVALELSHPVAYAERSRDASDEFVRVERLLHIVDRAGIQAATPGQRR